MADFDLLSAVQPRDGWFALLAIGAGGARRQAMFDNRADFDARVEKMKAAGGWNLFYGVAKYANGEGRKKSNVSALRTFWLDLDCRGKKPSDYADIPTALQDIRNLCKGVGLPLPIIVISGGGVHAYWPLSEDIDRARWERGAAALAATCRRYNVLLDPSVMEVARVLRIPGTFNYKSDPPEQAAVLREASTPLSFDKFMELVGGPPQKGGLTLLGASLKDTASFPKSVFSLIIERSQQGYGCEQLLHCHEQRATLPEPMWRAALSIANLCEDRIDAIKSVSEDYPDYSLDRAIRKAESTAGPYTCLEFAKHNPAACEGCTLFGRIKSPITIGTEKFAPPGVDLQNIDPETGKPYVIPEYPAPYFRGKKGGIWRNPSTGQESDPICIFPYDLYIMRRLKDSTHGYSFVLRYHTPSDGVADFILTNRDFADNSELRKRLAAEDITVNDAAFGSLVGYLLTSLGFLRQQTKAEKMRTQFGWAENDSKFIVGDREVGATGTVFSPPSPSTAPFIKHLGPRGSFEKWREVFELYDTPGLEPHAFAALTAFGAPLLRFFGQRGLVLNVIHPTSGTGKTTILHMCNSVWGSPDGLISIKEDTMNARLFRLGVFNNLPVTLDEATNMPGLDVSTMLYSATHGKAKERMRSSANSLRENNTTWQTMMLCSSNASFYEKLANLKSTPDGELMRLIEYRIAPVEVLDKNYAKEMFDHQLLENYGHAGLIYANYLIKNAEAVVEMCGNIQRKIDAEMRLTARERFWSAGVGANLAGGMLAKQAGVLKWDLNRIYKWAGDTMLPDLRDQVVLPVATGASAVVGDFINRHMQNILVVQAGADRRTGMSLLPIMQPRNDLLIRYEPDTKLMYIVIKAFRDDCVHHQINYRDTIKELEKTGIYLRYENKRLSKGMTVTSPAVACMVLDCSHSDFIDLSSLETPPDAL